MTPIQNLTSAQEPMPSAAKQKKILKPSPLDSMTSDDDNSGKPPEPQSEQKQVDSWPKSLRYTCESAV